MTNQHPITPPPSLTDKWNNLPLSTEEIFVIAAQWGSDQELEACCEWFANEGYGTAPDRIRNHRRPKPPSLKEQALADLEHLLDIAKASGVFNPPDTIRKALEALPND
jgi:hypothetical protein